MKEPESELGPTASAFKPTSNIWIERNGSPSAITPRFQRFLEDKLSGLSLDTPGDVVRRPDYSCLGGSVAIEIKTLEESPQQRLENAIAGARESEHWPAFYGGWELPTILKHFPDDERAKLNRTAIDRLGRAIRNHLKKANDQLRNHRLIMPSVHLSLVTLINEDFPEYSPDAVTYIVNRVLHETREDGSPSCGEIDAVLYLTERHAIVHKGRAHYPLTIVHGADIEAKPVALELLRRVTVRWGDTLEPLDCDDLPPDHEGLVTIEQRPETMKRHELWAMEYRRKPYMKSWNDEDVLSFSDDLLIRNLLAFDRLAPVKFPQDHIMKMMEHSTHVLAEAARRGLTANRLSPTRDRLLSAIDRTTYPPRVKRWMQAQMAPPNS